MRALVPGFALLTLACGSAATVANNAIAEAQAGAAGGDAWAGHYEGPTDGGHGILDIRAGRTAGSYDVRIELAAPGCGGDAEGPGTIRNGRLIVTAPTMTGEQCILEFTRAGSSLRSTERGACAMQHGPSCDFTGTLRRTGAAQTAAVSANNGGSQGKVENPATAYAELVRSTDNGGPVGTMGGSDSSASGESWIVGAWVYDRFSCGTVADLTLNADGTYHAEGEIGNWRLNGTNLTIIVRQVYETPGDEVTLRTPRTSTVRAERTRRGLRIHATDGQPSDLMRC